MGTANIIGSITKFVWSIFWNDDGESGLLQKALVWFKEMIAKFNVIAILKDKYKMVKEGIAGALGMDEESKKLMEDLQKLLEEMNKEDLKEV